MPQRSPRIDRVLETALYVDDLDRARGFYEDVIGLAPITADRRFVAYDVGGNSILLVFRRGATRETVTLPGGTIPPHHGQGPLHMAFGIAEDDLAAWEDHLCEHGIGIEARTDWTRGGRSIYVRDPDDHLIEFVTPRVWPTY